MFFGDVFLDIAIFGMGSFIVFLILDWRAQCHKEKVERDQRLREQRYEDALWLQQERMRNPMGLTPRIGDRLNRTIRLRETDFIDLPHYWDAYKRRPVPQEKVNWKKEGF